MIGIAVLALLAIAGLVYYALMPKSEVIMTDPDPQFAQTGSAINKPPSGYKRVEFEKLSFEVPDAWIASSKGLDSSIKEYSYANAASGDYLRVRVGGGGSTTASDASWRYATQGGGTGYIQLVKESVADCNSAEEPLCTKGDGMLDIYANIDTGGQIGVIDDQLYAIYIGNSKSESVDRQLYKDILATGYVAQ